MNRRFHDQLIKDTEALRRLVGECSSETIAGMCSAYVLDRTKFNERFGILAAPGRQIFFILGLMLTTPEPANAREFDHDDWQRSVNLSNSIYNSYLRMFSLGAEESSVSVDEWIGTRDVAASAFLHYFSTGILATREQITERIRRYVAPFDNELKVQTNISASEALHIADWMAANFERTAEGLHQTANAEKEARTELLLQAALENWDPVSLKQEMRKAVWRTKSKDLFQLLDSFLKVTRSSIRRQFGHRIADAFWKLYVSQRGTISDFTYLTERNPAEERPLFQVEEGVALCPSLSALYWSIVKASEAQLANGSHRHSFLRKRDKILESQVEHSLRRIFADTADYYPEVFETEALQYEHDLVLYWGSKLFIVEAKASPPVEPFRDPEKALTRLRRAFRSDRGIQKAYEQADRIRKRLEDGHTIDLFDRNRNRIAEIKPEGITDVYAICITRDDFGPLAADLSLLLEKEEDVPYPWVADIFDLQTIAGAWEYFGWGPDRLCEYLGDRIRLNGRLRAWDEMDIVGFFVRHGTLSYLNEAEVDRLQLTPDYSNVFDRIYEAKHGGEQVLYAPAEPTMGDFGEMLKDGSLDHFLTKDASGDLAGRKKQGRNELCNCGSGRKYKRCCGRQF